jgi:hypothetical protein
LNRQRTYHFLGLLALLVVSGLVCIRFYADIFREPGAYLFGAEGDGLKNYFTVAYQAVHGNGWDFKGMLYPFGDHLLFADGQPLVTWILQQANITVENGHHIIAAMNLLMIGSLMLCAALLYLILRRCMVGPWFAVPFAVVIAFLSPQLARFAGHYALSYAFFIPLIWYLLIRMEASRPWLWTLLLALSVLAFTFIQPYYLLIAVAFLGSILLWDGVLFVFRKKKPVAFLPKLVALLFPFVAFTAYMAIADPYTDRPAAPYGLFGYVASIQSVFVPVMEPFRSLFTSYFFRLFVPAHWEGYAFVGLVPTFLGVCALALFAYKRKWRNAMNPVLPNALRSVWIPAFIVLLFSMAVFHHLGLHWLGEHFSAIRQFRSLGRMAWVFYYVFAVWAVVYLYRMYRFLASRSNGQLKPLAISLVFLSLGWWTLDTIVNIKAVKEQMIANRNGKEFFGPTFRNDLLSNGIDPANFQAILPLPFELIGSEKVELSPFSKATPIAMQAAFSTGIPMMNGVMSRTSLSVTEQLAQLVASPLMPHAILDKLASDRDLLLIVVDEGQLTAGERFLMDHANLLISRGTYRLFRLNVAYLKQAYQTARNKAVSDSLAVETPFLHTAETFIAKDEMLLDTLISDGSYEFSFWIRIDPKSTSLPILEWTEGRAQLYSKRCAANADLANGWLRIAQPFEVTGDRPFRFWFRQSGETICRTLLRPLIQNVRNSSNGQRYYNNIPLNEP